jgi:SAM-dependent methyltransferase
VSWQEFWNGNTTIYVNQRHKEVHYRKIANDIVAHVASPRARVLDFGCGEALSAEVIAEACEQLFLCDAAETVRARIMSRVSHVPNARVITPSAVDAMPDGSFDLIVANSVIQYLSRQELEAWLSIWRRTLSADGKLVLGDIVPRGVAAGGLVKTALSDYRRKRAELGLLQLDEAEIVELARQAGLQAGRHALNLGHNPARLTIVATPSPTTTTASMPALDVRVPRYETLEPAVPYAAAPR